ncbi:MAG: hypothetical protein DRN28_01100, partial [Thermoplasmata archaeon]
EVEIEEMEEMAIEVEEAQEVEMEEEVEIPEAEEKEAEAKPVIYKTIKCPHCGGPIPITTTERPITVICPNCGAKGKLVK